MRISSWVRRIRQWRLKADRPFKLLAIVAITTIAMIILERLFVATDMNSFQKWVRESVIYGPLFYPDASKIEWKDRLQAIVLFLGLPVAFCLWYWRDRNVRDEIENARKDINLKEFQEVQLRAVGIVGAEGSSKESKNVLQVAALHQLKGFLKGDFGSAFMRPAFETYSALLSRSDDLDRMPGDEEDFVFVPNEIFKALRIIVYEDWKNFFWEDYEQKKAWPLSGRSFHHIELPFGADLSGLDLSRVNFFRSKLTGVNFSRTRCWETNFSHCDMRTSLLLEASCEEAIFDHCDLAGLKASYADFSKASLKEVKFHAAELKNASFFGANGTNCKFVNASIENVCFNDCRLSGIDFSNSRLTGSKFVSAQIFDGYIGGAVLSACDFSYACLDGFFPDQAKSCVGVIINKKTQLPHPYLPTSQELLSSEILEVHQLWEQFGAKLDNTPETFQTENKNRDERIMYSRKIKEDMNASLKL